MRRERTKPYGSSHYREEWNTVYRTSSRGNLVYDRWLERYASHFSALGAPVLDLGSGYGNDTMWLLGEGCDTVSCDYALESLRRLEGGAKKICCDMLHALPFREEAFGAVVANLSLHYFSWQDTIAVLDEIERVLATGGALLCRVKSVADSEYGRGDFIEKNYFAIGGKRKRFFSKEELQLLFRRWEILRLVEGQVTRFEHKRAFWEAAVRKK